MKNYKQIFLNNIEKSIPENNITKEDIMGIIESNLDNFIIDIIKNRNSKIINKIKKLDKIDKNNLLVLINSK